MDKIYYSKEEIQKLEVLGCGDRSVVYKDPNRNKALKIYKKNSVCFLNDALAYANNKKIEKYNVIVPEGIVCVDHVNAGYYSAIAHGYTIFHLVHHYTLSIKTSDFMNAYEDACNHVVQLSQSGFCLYDLHEKNLVYDIDKKQIMFIDVDAWIKKRKSKKMMYLNLHEFEYSVNLNRIKKHLS